MNAPTHMLGGILFAQAATLLIMPGQTASLPLMLVGGIVGSLIPDIDHPGSKISRTSVTTRVTSFALSGLVKHRGPIHTPLFIAGAAALLSLLPFFTAGIGAYLLHGLIAGMLSHLVLDSLNPTGIMWLWPLTKKRFRLMKITTGGWGEMVSALVLLAMNLVLAGRGLLAFAQGMQG